MRKREVNKGGRQFEKGGESYEVLLLAVKVAAKVAIRLHMVGNPALGQALRENFSLEIIRRRKKNG